MEHVQVTSEPLTYSRENHDTSFFSDLFRFRVLGDAGAKSRLEQGTAEARAMSSAATHGGDFLPPLYFGDLYAEFKQQTRVAAGLVWQRDLPSMGTAVSVPKVTVGAHDVAQTADNQSVTTADETTDVATATVSTVAGRVEVSRQILERSQPGLDEVLATDLFAAYGKNLDNYVINGLGSAGQPKGLLVISGTNGVTYTAASPTVDVLYPKLADAMRQVAENVFEPATAWIMTARRWAWIMAAVDASKRPLDLPSGNDPMVFQQYALNASNTGADPVGSLMRIPVYIDENLPKTQGAGTNQDVIMVAAWRKHILWESPGGPRVFQFPDQSGSSTATIRVEAFNYAAFTGERYASATSIITGTGLAAPTF